MKALALTVAFAALPLPAVADDWRPIFGNSPQIIDADTIRIGNTVIRLWGIDAPERHTVEGQEAALWLDLLLGHERVVCLDTGGRTYGRVVAVCCNRDGDVAAQMVELGHARDWDEAHPDGPKYSGGFYQGELPGDACRGRGPRQIETLLREE